MFIVMTFSFVVKVAMIIWSGSLQYINTVKYIFTHHYMHKGKFIVLCKDQVWHILLRNVFTLHNRHEWYLCPHIFLPKTCNSVIGHFLSFKLTSHAFSALFFFLVFVLLAFKYYSFITWIHSAIFFLKALIKVSTLDFSIWLIENNHLSLLCGLVN